MDGAPPEDNAHLIAMDGQAAKAVAAGQPGSQPRCQPAGQ